MAAQVVNINCPGCGAPVDTGQKTCKFCKQPIVISTFTSVMDMPMPMINKYAGAYQKVLAENPDNKDINNSIGFCFLKLKLYDKALNAFEKAMVDNFDNSETFFYAAICLLKGQKAFVANRETIDKIIEYVNAATMIEPRGIYYYFLAYIKQDYFGRKFLSTSPNWEETLEMAKNTGESFSPNDIEQLFSILGVERPSVL